MRLRLDPHTELRSLVADDAAAFHAVITRNRAHLDHWLRWSSSIDSLTAASAFITDFTRKESVGDGFHLGIWHQHQLVGGAVCWYIHRHHRNAEVGYWLDADQVGKGFASRAATAVVDHLFRVERLHRIEMQCAVENRASRAVAERLGLTAEGTRRESHWITDRFLDHVVYGILAREWGARPS
ncbi:MAG TPA: GNAT family protein [Gemmatimonadales bacterium]|nr:GNAT family protein [Gemmatimonadales bacterium]